MSNVIHNRYCNGGITGQYIDSQDRGPQGEQGERGNDGDPGPQGEPGISVARMYIDENEQLVAVMTDDTEINAGEIPKAITKRVFVTEIDGSANTIPLVTDGKPVDVKRERVSHILINGVTYTDDFDIKDGALVLEFGETPIPSGKLEVFTISNGVLMENGGAVTSVNGRVGDVEITAEIEPITDEEIHTITTVVTEGE